MVQRATTSLIRLPYIIETNARLEDFHGHQRFTIIKTLRHELLP